VMKRLLAALLLLSTALLGQAQKELLKNSKVTVSQVEIPANATVADKHQGDLLTVIVGKRGKSKLAPGEAFLTPAGAASSTRNKSDSALSAVAVEFASPVGARDRHGKADSRYCNPGSKTACVSEKYLFCTTKVCVEDVRMGAGAVSTKHSHDTDHMIIAVTDYSLSDDIVGKSVVMRNVKSGGVEYIPAGITHTLTNKSPGEARFVVVVFR